MESRRRLLRDLSALANLVLNDEKSALSLQDQTLVEC